MKSQSSSVEQIVNDDDVDEESGIGERMLLRWYDQRTSIVSNNAARSSVHTYPIIEITVALNAHRVSLAHGNRLRALTD